MTFSTILDKGDKMFENLNQVENISNSNNQHQTVVSHKDCLDGFASAYNHYLKYGHNAKYFFSQYGDKPIPLDMFKDKDVFMYDFSYPRDYLIKINEVAKSFIVLDHHKTAEANCRGLDFCKFDMTKSGSMLSWEYLFPNKPPSWMSSYVMDKDLWQWKLPNAQEIVEGLDNIPRSFEVWNKYDDEKGKESCLKLGEVICLHRDNLIAGALSRKPMFANVEGHKVPYVNINYFISETLNRLCKKYKDCPFAVGFFMDSQGRFVHSLRSLDFDVTDICKKYKGGGHEHAGGFMHNKLFPIWEDK